MAKIFDFLEISSCAAGFIKFDYMVLVEGKMGERKRKRKKKEENKDNEGMTALHVACWDGKRGIDGDLADKWKWLILK